MAKRFFYISLGILCLAVAYNLGARSAEADVDPSMSGQLIGISDDMAFSMTGEAWGTGLGWVRHPEHDLPVPASEVKFLANRSPTIILVTYADELYVNTGSEWEYHGPFPGSGTPTKRDSWGGVKSRFRR